MQFRKAVLGQIRSHVESGRTPMRREAETREDRTAVPGLPTGLAQIRTVPAEEVRSPVGIRGEGEAVVDLAEARKKITQIHPPIFQTQYRKLSIHLMVEKLKDTNQLFSYTYLESNVSCFSA